MEKYQRSERISALQRILYDSPGKIFTLGNFTDMLGCAKSSVSEDIDIIRGSLEKQGIGTIETIPGASSACRCRATPPYRAAPRPPRAPGARRPRGCRRHPGDHHSPDEAAVTRRKKGLWNSHEEPYRAD